MMMPDMDNPPPAVREAIDAIRAAGFDAPDTAWALDVWANAIEDLTERRANGADPAAVAEEWMGLSQETYPRWRPEAPELRWAFMRVYRYVLDCAVVFVEAP